MALFAGNGTKVKIPSEIKPTFAEKNPLFPSIMRKVVILNENLHSETCLMTIILSPTYFCQERYPFFNSKTFLYDYCMYLFFLLSRMLAHQGSRNCIWKQNSSVDFLSLFSFKNLTQQKKVKIGNTLQILFFQELKQ